MADKGTNTLNSVKYIINDLKLGSKSLHILWNILCYDIIF